MRLLDLIDTYDALNESVLTTNFSWGFELEGICTQEKEPGDKVGGYHTKQSTGIPAKVEAELDELIGVQGRMGTDVSVTPDERGGWSFEYASGVLPFSPKECNRILKLLRDELPKLKIYTNKTCGFHCHTSYNDIDKKTAAWIICCISIDEDLKKELTELEVGDLKIDFFDTQYAGISYYDEIKEAIKSDNWDKVNAVINGERENEKYRNIRIHPQGTMEWRGPRNFIGNNETIMEFMKKLYRIVFKFGKIADSKTWKGSGIEINREDVDDNISVRLDFNSDTEKKIAKKNEALQDKLIENPLMITSLRPSQVTELIYLGSFMGRFMSSLTPETALKLWEKTPDQVRLDYIKKLRLTQNEALRTFVHKLKNEKYTLPDEYINIFKEWYDFFIYFDGHLNGVPLKLFELYKDFQDKKGFKRYIIDHKDEIPMEAWDYLLKPQFWSFLPYLDMPIKVQKKFVKKNPYNVQYIKNPDASIIEALKQKVPDIEQYIARYYK